MGIIKAGMWDKMQYIFRNYYDRMMHTCLHYNGNLNKEALIEAYTIIVTKVPILRSKYVANPIKPYWKITPHVNADNFFSFVEVSDLEIASDTFLNTCFPAQSEYQIRVMLARCGDKDTLCTLVNHMCFDGSDLKYFNNKLAECYNNIVTKNIHTVDIKGGDRSDMQLYNSMPDEDKKSAKKLYRNASIVKEKVQFPYDGVSSKDRHMIVKRKISAEFFRKLKAVGKQNNATINDIVLAAYYRSFYSINKMNSDEALSIASMIDLRRHINTKATAGLTNMTGLFMCRLEHLGKDMSETITRVREALGNIKGDKFIGLYGPPLLRLAFNIFPNIIAENCIKIGYSNPLLGMSNIGIIDDKALIMGGVGLLDAFMTGATKYKPYIQLAFTTFRDEITFTVAVKANNNDRRTIERFLTGIETELQNFIG
ncbi:MAG: hypothetical protein EOM87_00590 [Clostridia bacterium]|nr:hypothetical protein [Clostridia bacterium]